MRLRRRGNHLPSVFTANGGVSFYVHNTSFLQVRQAGKSLFFASFQEEILSQLNEQTQKHLVGLSLPSPEGFLKHQREKIRELEQDIVYLSGKRDLLQKQQLESQSAVDRLTAQMQDLQSESQL